MEGGVRCVHREAPQPPMRVLRGKSKAEKRRSLADGLRQPITFAFALGLGLRGRASPGAPRLYAAVFPARIACARDLIGTTEVRRYAAFVGGRGGRCAYSSVQPSARCAAMSYAALTTPK